MKNGMLRCQEHPVHIGVLLLGCWLPVGKEEESNGCEAKDFDAGAQEGADGQEVDGEITLEHHPKEEGDEAQDVDDE